MASKRKIEYEPNLSKDRKRGRVEENSEKPSTAKKPRADQEKSYWGWLNWFWRWWKMASNISRIDILSTQLENKKKGKEDANISLQSANANNSQLSKQLENERKAKEEALMRLQAENVKLSRQLQIETKAKEDALASLQSAKAKNAQLSKQFENERKIKEDALIRLSSLASNKLRNNNPNIADLSDQNRPTKLSEQFSELYDNEWTDAFDELQKISGDKDDKEIISYLRCFLLEINSVCSSLSASKLNEIQRQFVLPAEPSDENNVPPELFRKIKEEIISTAPKYIKAVKVHVHSHLKKWLPWKSLEACLESGNVKRYIDKCTEVCWYMSVQDPQMVIEGNPSPDGKFDSSKYREYTKKGPYQQFVVWPVLCLYQGGPILSKGVAQGSKLQNTKSGRNIFHS